MLKGSPSGTYLGQANIRIVGGVDAFTAPYTVVADGLNVKITASPQDIFPLDLFLSPTTTFLHVAVTDSQGKSVTSPQKLKFVVTIPEDLVERGGHAHTGKRPLGTIGVKSSENGPVIRTVTLTGDSKDTMSFQETTDSSGDLYMTYTASKFGGVVTIEGSPVSSPPANKDNSAKLTVSVPGLMLLPANASLYVKTGGTLCPSEMGKPRCHPGPLSDPGNDMNHYGDPVFLRKITSITSDFKHYCQSHSCSQALSRAIQNETVLINDMSLPLGGGFDIFGNWDADISPSTCFQEGHGHCDHREGKAVDYNLTDFPLGSNPNSAEARTLYDLIKRDHLNRHMESDHWHIQVKPRQL